MNKEKELLDLFAEKAKLDISDAMYIETKGDDGYISFFGEITYKIKITKPIKNELTIIYFSIYQEIDGVNVLLDKSMYCVENKTFVPQNEKYFDKEIFDFIEKNSNLRECEISKKVIYHDIINKPIEEKRTDYCKYFSIKLFNIYIYYAKQIDNFDRFEMVFSKSNNGFVINAIKDDGDDLSFGVNFTDRGIELNGFSLNKEVLDFIYYNKIHLCENIDTQKNFEVINKKNNKRGL